MKIRSRLSLNSLFALIFTALVLACQSPTVRSRLSVGTPDHSGGIVNVGSDASLAIPSDFNVQNNYTDKEKYLRLEWKPVEGATGYRIYRGIFPHHGEKSDLPHQAFKLLVELSQPYPLPSVMTYDHQIPEVPLRRYQYRITAVRDWGESEFSSPVIGWRKPVDPVEALRDIDYTIHFAQCNIPNFGAMNLDEILSGRASGSYHYASKVGNIKSHFSNYADFETILTTPSNKEDFNMAINWSPLGTKMNGYISVSGLYDAKISYKDLIGVVGGLTKGGTISIEYNGQTRTFSYTQAKEFMKTVATSENEVHPMPPRREWDEADPNYVRTIRR